MNATANNQAALLKRCWCQTLYDPTRATEHEQHFSHQLKVQLRTAVYEPGTTVLHYQGKHRHFANITG